MFRKRFGFGGLWEKKKYRYVGRWVYILRWATKLSHFSKRTSDRLSPHVKRDSVVSLYHLSSRGEAESISSFTARLQSFEGEVSLTSR